MLGFQNEVRVEERRRSRAPQKLEKIKFKYNLNLEIIMPRKYGTMIKDYLSETTLGKIPSPWCFESKRIYKEKVKLIGYELIGLEDEVMFQKLINEHKLEESKAKAFVEESRDIRKRWIPWKKRIDRTLDDIF